MVIPFTKMGETKVIPMSRRDERSRSHSFYFVHVPFEMPMQIVTVKQGTGYSRVAFKNQVWQKI